jgi:hypothetical protein
MSSLQIMWVEVDEQGWPKSIDKVGWRLRVERLTAGARKRSMCGCVDVKESVAWVSSMSSSQGIAKVSGAVGFISVRSGVVMTACRKDASVKRRMQHWDQVQTRRLDLAFAPRLQRSMSEVLRQL